MKVVDLHHYKGPHVYCGRRMPGRPGSPLANPFKVREHGSRCLELYRRHLWAMMRRRDDQVMAALRSLTDDSILGCWCVDLEGEAVVEEPEVCHCQVIVKAWLHLKLEGQ